MMPLASVVIPTRNRAAALEATVRALWMQTVGAPALEVIVVDNLSSDETPRRVEQLRAESPMPLRYARMDRDRGPAAARNRGASLASGRYVVFLDSDVEIDPAWIETAVTYLQANGDVAILGGTLVYGAKPDRVNMFGGELSRIGLGWDAHEGQPATDLVAEEHRLWAPSSALIVRRELLDAIGMFDDTFYFGFEDSDLGWRANLAGARCVCLPALRARHHAVPSGRTAGEAIVFHYSKNRLRSMLKNYSIGSLMVYLPLYLVYSAGEFVARPSRAVRLKAFRWNLVHLRDTMRARRRVQLLRRCSDRDLAPLFARRLLPPTTLARRRRNERLLLTSVTSGDARLTSSTPV